MKHIKFLTVLLLFIIISPEISNAQVKLAIGPSIGLNFNIYSGDALKKNMTGLGGVFSGQIDLSFTRDKSLGLLTNIAFYDNRHGSLSEDFNSTTRNGTPFEYTTDLGVGIAYLQLEPMFKYRIPSIGLYFIFGPALGFNISSSITTTVTINTDGIAFEDGTNVQTQTEDLNNTQMRFALKSGMGVDIPLSGLLTLAPQVAVGIGLTDVIENGNYSILTIQAGVALKFNVIN